MPVRSAVQIQAPPERAFAAFAERLGEWWPREYTWSQGTLEAIGIEAGEGGLCFERGPHGFRLDWGRVVAWEPPARLAFTWQISPTRVPEPDPDRASTVEVRFEAVGDTGDTEVALEHRDFERHGDGADGYAEAMGSPQGWPYILAGFAAWAAE